MHCSRDLHRFQAFAKGSVNIGGYAFNLKLSDYVLSDSCHWDRSSRSTYTHQGALTTRAPATSIKLNAILSTFSCTVNSRASNINNQKTPASLAPPPSALTHVMSRLFPELAASLRHTNVPVPTSQTWSRIPYGASVDASITGTAASIMSTAGSMRSLGMLPRPTPLPFQIALLVTRLATTTFRRRQSKNGSPFAIGGGTGGCLGFSVGVVSYHFL
jgi:hypothetical protein